MSGGRERSVSVWDARRTLLLLRQDTVSGELAHIAEIEEPPTRQRVERTDALVAERRQIQIQLAQLGPAPRAKMG